MGMYRDLLISAKHNNSEAVMELYKRCQPHQKVQLRQRKI